MSEILPCPFCGSEASYRGPELSDANEHEIYCCGGGCSAQMTAERKEDVFELWNRRPSPQPVAWIVDAPDAYFATVDSTTAERHRKERNVVTPLYASPAADRAMDAESPFANETVQHVYITDKGAVCVGVPAKFPESVRDDDVRRHNCDTFGCSTLEHVLTRVRFTDERKHSGQPDIDAAAREIVARLQEGNNILGERAGEWWVKVISACRTVHERILAKTTFTRSHWSRIADHTEYLSQHLDSRCRGLALGCTSVSDPWLQGKVADMEVWGVYASAKAVKPPILPQETASA